MQTDSQIGRYDGWTDRHDRLPSRTDGDDNGMVLVWHVYQGAMLAYFDDFAHSRYNVCWMRIPSDAPWIKAKKRLPTKGDADELSCVLAKDKHGDIKVIGYHQFTWNSALAYWMRLPAPPSD